MPRPTSKDVRATTARIRAVLDDIDANWDEISRRCEYPARDGFPSSSLGGGASAGIARPTEQAAFAKPMPDKVGNLAGQVFRNLREMELRARSATGSIKEIFNVESESRGRVSQGRFCDFCEAPIDKDDDSRSGLCGSHRKKWYRARKALERVRPGQLLTREAWMDRERAKAR